MRPWLMVPILFLGLLFLLMPFWIALGDAAVWTLYGSGLLWAIVIGLLASRWIRVTTSSGETATASSASSICAAGKGDEGSESSYSNSNAQLSPDGIAPGRSSIGGGRGRIPPGPLSPVTTRQEADQAKGPVLQGLSSSGGGI
jgi:hypothetical protein